MVPDPLRGEHSSLLAVGGAWKGCVCVPCHRVHRAAGRRAERRTKIAAGTRRGDGHEHARCLWRWERWWWWQHRQFIVLPLLEVHLSCLRSQALRRDSTRSAIDACALCVAPTHVTRRYTLGVRENGQPRNRADVSPCLTTHTNGRTARHGGASYHWVCQVKRDSSEAPKPRL